MEWSDETNFSTREEWLTLADSGGDSESEG